MGGEGWANLARGEGGRPRGCVVLCLRCGAGSWVVEGVPSRVVCSDLYDQSVCLVSVVDGRWGLLRLRLSPRLWWWPRRVGVACVRLPASSLALRSSFYFRAVRCDV